MQPRGTSWDKVRNTVRIILTALSVVLSSSIGFGQTLQPVRGVYPLGMNALNSGVTPESGFTYSNLFLYYSRNQFKGANGEVVATGNNSVLMDLNTVVWVSEKTILCGGKLSLAATLIINNNSLTSDVVGPISGGGGFGDSYYQPFILGRQRDRTAIKVIYGFLAPTGKFRAGTNDNVGNGYWVSAFSSGQTFYLTRTKSTSLSAFQMYEIHGTQKDTNIHPGQTWNLDYSLMQNIPLHNDNRLQIGLVAYGQWQTTDTTGPTTPEQASVHYRVTALGFASSLVLPTRKVSLSFKYFREFSNKSTFQGNSVQISSTINF
jgi:hypothetical protein